MKKYDELIQFILENIGGINNVISANHCATRLRL
ncbi:MAG: PTS transporter subunit EIIB, partial [Lactobacillus sp.]|nr:PTS transporter subunit EIIB [Lactobacillus sp.]